MNLGELRQEVFDRGFHFVDPPTRVETWLNRVYQRACERYPWPFLEDLAESTAPVVIDNLRSVLVVVDKTARNPLAFADRRTIVENDPDISTTGPPDYWYLGEGNIKVWPVNTDNTITVRYIKAPDDLSGESDVPLFPSRFHYMLVDGAVAHAYEDSDNFEAAQVAWSNYFQAIEEAAATLMVPNYDNPADIVIRGSVDW